MSYYARNHLQDDWETHSAADMQHRVQAAEREAGWYFDQATRQQKAAFDAAMRALPATTPHANVARDAARAAWQEATAAARGLFERSVDCLLASGEMSAELDRQWTLLIDRAAQVAE